MKKSSVHELFSNFDLQCTFKCMYVNILIYKRDRIRPLIRCPYGFSLSFITVINLPSVQAMFTMPQIALTSLRSVQFVFDFCFCHLHVLFSNEMLLLH